MTDPTKESEHSVARNGWQVLRPLLWLAPSQTQRSDNARARIENIDTKIRVSAVSAFELGPKYARGSLKLGLASVDWFNRALATDRVRSLDLDAPSALRAAALTRLHAVPFDQFLIGTANEHRLTLLTPDPRIHACPDIRVAW